MIIKEAVAQTLNDVIGQVDAPEPIKGVSGAAGIGNVLTTIINLIYTASTIAFLFMFLYAAFQWITSGGDKEKVASARRRIQYAIIGLVLLALSFMLVTIFGRITGFSGYFNFSRN